MVSDHINRSADDSSSRGVSTGSRKNDPLIGTLVAERYRILELLGRGGMGVVYKARHELMERTVAIKLLLPQLISDESAAARFQREARASSKINHANIIALHDFGRTEDGVPYIVMDYIEGESLADILKREKQLGTSRTAHIFSQVCDALQHAHDLGIIHRDLKPGNIMIVQNEDERDIVKVVDFGIAKMYESDEGGNDVQKLTTTGELFGSPVYMSPEQCGGYELDARSDIYSLGCVIYETLTGKLPCVGKTVLETISKQLASPPATFSEARPDLYIPEWVELIVMRALQKDRAKRQQTMRDMQQELNVGVSTHSTASIRALNPSAVSIKTRSVSSAQMPVAKSAAASGSSTEWKRYALYTVAVVVLLGGAMFAISTMISNQQIKEKTRLSVPPIVEQHEEQKPVEAPVERTTKPVVAEPTTKRVVAEPTTKRVVELHTKPAVHPAPSQLIKKATTTKPAVHEALPPPPSKHKHGSDFYDYESKHEHSTGDPVALPVKDWSPDQ
jgi:serine/threonine protein kinase